MLPARSTLRRSLCSRPNQRFRISLECLDEETFALTLAWRQIVLGPSFLAAPAAGRWQLRPRDERTASRHREDGH